MNLHQNPKICSFAVIFTKQIKYSQYFHSVKSESSQLTCRCVSLLSKNWTTQQLDPEVLQVGGAAGSHQQGAAQSLCFLTSRVSETVKHVIIRCSTVSLDLYFFTVFLMSLCVLLVIPMMTSWQNTIQVSAGSNQLLLHTLPTKFLLCPTKVSLLDF